MSVAAGAAVPSDQHEPGAEIAGCAAIGPHGGRQDRSCPERCQCEAGARRKGGKERAKETRTL